MARSSKPLDVYLEIGQKRIFAGAIEWPGWSRSGRDEGSALQALFDYVPRYAEVLRSARLGFKVPAARSEFKVVERLKGDMTTDFGTPGTAPSADKRRVDDAELYRLQAVLRACWRTFDAAVSAAAGKELRKGPRGGGRDAEGIIRHVLNGQGAYLSRVGWKLEAREDEEPGEAMRLTRQAVLKALAASAHGELPSQGPRGGVMWKPRYFARRSAWHVLDHAWEIEDRIV
ncbi:MAG: hypothetical protein ACM3S0_14450 [Acidobacteriota bacterium]